jgi:hypothetical protein
MTLEENSHAPESKVGLGKIPIGLFLVVKVFASHNPLTSMQHAVTFSLLFIPIVSILKWSRFKF